MKILLRAKKGRLKKIIEAALVTSLLKKIDGKLYDKNCKTRTRNIEKAVVRINAVVNIFLTTSVSELCWAIYFNTELFSPQTATRERIMYKDKAWLKIPSPAGPKLLPIKILVITPLKARTM
jgi:hypothetical protein